MTFTASVRSFQVPATPGTAAWPPSRPSVPTSRATRVTSSAKRRSVAVSALIVSASSATSPLRVHGDRAGQVAPRDRGGRVGDRPHLVGEVGRHRVHRVGERPPRARDAAHVGLAAEPPVGADLARHAGDLVGERGQLVDHRVHGAADAPVLAAQRPALDLQRHVLGEVALGDRLDHAGDLRRGRGEVVDQRVDGTGPVAPRAVVGLLVEPVAHPALTADAAPDPQEVAIVALRNGGHVVELIGERARRALPARQPHVEPTPAQLCQRVGELGEHRFRRIGGSVVIGGIEPRLPGRGHGLGLPSRAPGPPANCSTPGTGSPA